MESATFSQFVPIIAAIIGPMLLLIAASMRYQHLESLKTRELIEKSRIENRDHIERSSKENRDLIERSSKENRDLIEKSSKENRDLINENRKLIEMVRAGLADARERLARIEGYLRISPPHQPDAGSSEGEADAA